MHFEITPNETELSRRAADLVLDVVRREPRAVLILATGATPTETYAELARHASVTDFSQVRIFALDEWGGLPRSHPESCHAILASQVVTPLGLAPNNFYSFDGAAPFPVAECRRYAAALATTGPAHLALVGLGVNGHIGFNEPAESLPAEAAVTQLAPGTADRLRSRLNGLPLPEFGLTLSLVEVMQSAQVLLLANGTHKAEPVRAMLAGPLTSRCPATLLRLHPNAFALLDRAAASALPPVETRP
jgi:glucosamine-6-phosphate deaminase